MQNIEYNQDFFAAYNITENDTAEISFWLKFVLRYNAQRIAINNTQRSFTTAINDGRG
jgi:hypothetical protein